MTPICALTPEGVFGWPGQRNQTQIFQIQLGKPAATASLLGQSDASWLGVEGRRFWGSAWVCPGVGMVWDMGTRSCTELTAAPTVTPVKIIQSHINAQTHPAKKRVWLSCLSWEFDIFWSPGIPRLPTVHLGCRIPWNVTNRSWIQGKA